MERQDLPDRTPLADLDVERHTAAPVAARDRHTSPYTTREKVLRLLWACVQSTVFRLSFHDWYRWRNVLLRCFGAKIHRTAVVRRTVRIECPWNLTMGESSCLGDHAIAYCLGPVTLGKRVSVSQYAHLCAGSHDYTQPHMPLLRPPITIEDDAWIAADAFVGPGVTVGEGAILGARGVAMRDLEGWTVFAGNRAIAVGARRKPGGGGQRQVGASVGSEP